MSGRHGWMAAERGAPTWLNGFPKRHAWQLSHRHSIAADTHTHRTHLERQASGLGCACPPVGRTAGTAPDPVARRGGWFEEVGSGCLNV